MYHFFYSTRFGCFYGYYLIAFVLIGFGSVAGLSCSQKNEAPSIGFYFWKTVFQLSPIEQQYLLDAKVETLYIKYADIGINPNTGEVEPFSTLIVEDTSSLPHIRLVPCVFLTNEVFLLTSPEQTAALADSIFVLIRAYAFPFREVQFDCDWTPKSRASYFAFLREMRHRMPEIQLSVTIRLHQFKSPESTGIPPADRGALMCYNTGELEALEEENSILSIKAASKYLTSKAYPLPLDPILPIFAWALVFRSNSFWKIIPDPDWNTLNNQMYFRKTDNWFAVKRPLFMGGQYLKEGDLLRYEASSVQLLNAVVPMLSKAWTRKSKNLSFYHLNPRTPTAFPADSLRALLNDLTLWEKN